MRTNEYGDFRTLEEDIVWIWKLHGLEVIEERFEKDTWIIKAKREGKPIQSLLKKSKDTIVAKNEPSVVSSVSEQIKEQIDKDFVKPKQDGGKEK